MMFFSQNCKFVAIMSSHNLTFMFHNSEFINSEFINSEFINSEFVSCNSDVFFLRTARLS